MEYHVISERVFDCLTLKLILKIATGIFLTLLVALLIKDLYQTHPFSRAIDDLMDKYAPGFGGIETAYDQLKTGLATTTIKESDTRYETWERWYLPPEECLKPVLGNDLVKCTDHRIRARREFEKLQGDKSPNNSAVR